MRKFLLVFAVLLLSLNVFAVDAYFINLNSPFYDIIDDLYALEGLAEPSGTRPYSSAQARLVLSRIDKSSLSGYSLILYDMAADYVEDTVRWSFSDSFGMGAYLTVNPEMYAHTNTSDFRGENDWAYSYDDRARFLHLGLEFRVGSFFYTYADLMYTMGRYSADGALIKTRDDFENGIGAILPVGDTDFTLVEESRQYYDPFSSNIPLKSSEFEFEWPKRAFISFGGNQWSLLFGRDRVNWGNSRVSNFIIDEHVGYHDMFRLTFFTDKFSYEWANLFFDTRGNGNETKENGIRMLMAHRLEFRALSWLDFAISENVMYQAPTLSLHYLNPGFIFHNLNNRSMFNAIAALEMNITPMRGFDLYAQFVLDQAVAPNEDSSQGNAWGVLAGLEFTLSPHNTGVLSFNLEFDYTSPLLYRRDSVDFLMYQRSFTYDANYPLKLYYIGYKYGGDAMLLHLGIDYDYHDLFSLRLSVDGMLKGEMNMAKSHNNDGNNDGKPNYDGITPSGDEIQEILIVTLSGEYIIPKLPSWMGLSFSSSISYVGSLYYHKLTGNVRDIKGDFQFSFGIKFSI